MGSFVLVCQMEHVHKDKDGPRRASILRAVFKGTKKARI